MYTWSQVQQLILISLISTNEQFIGQEIESYAQGSYFHTF